MKIGSATDFALLGIQRGLAGARDNAAQIASAEQAGSDKPEGVVEPLIGLQQNSRQVAASAKVIQSVNDMLGSLFDDRA
ncbi:hypothetical protein QVG61_13170 [Thiohalobacter sp. IOR34]|uniref:hypothetical protein n=1 Tax=Thiohalobacter sp. IOR34 TaxID=3057176 RepID=UPI0025AF9959|nr:hypothetical protein [Thiohalobacter sp. IOR34]WJW75421.1 hypothetical protein QVG61_13170 [Thiohalobacter sp. IOR34]